MKNNHVSNLIHFLRQLFITQKEVEETLFEQNFRAMHKDGRLLLLGELIQRAAEKFPDKMALIFLEKQITYKELYYRAGLLSKHLYERGLRPGDRALLFIENSIDFYIGYFAIALNGAAVAPLNTFLQDKELGHITRDCRPAMIFTSQRHVEIFRKLAPLVPVITEVEIDWTTPLGQTLPAIQVPALRSDTLAALLYTSGTTGVPKGVMLSSANIMTNVAQGLSRINILENERLLGVLPLFHSFAQSTCIWGAFFVGCTVIILPKIERRYILDGLSKKPTIFLGVPALYGLLCLLKTVPLEGIRFFICGGDALPDKIRMFFALLYRRSICNGYGLTEASPFVAVDFDDELVATNTVGRPLINIDVRLVDDKEQLIPSERVGQLVIRGPNIMMGYFNAPEETAETIHDRWLLTGDLVTINEQGKIIICGREKDLIVHKGLKIYPQEVENIILSHPAIVRVGVVGYPDESSGQIPVAVVELKEGVEKEGLQEELIHLCAQSLAAYKIPRRFLVTENMPLTATSKVDKKVLRVLVLAKRP